jgi:hypothetical protein
VYRHSPFERNFKQQNSPPLALSIPWRTIFTASFFKFILVLSCVRGSVTNNNVFTIGRLDLLRLSFTITSHNQWLPKTRSIPYWTTSVFSSIPIYEPVTSSTNNERMNSHLRMNHSVLSQSQSQSELVYDWRFTANQFVLATSPLRFTTSNFIFELETCGYKRVELRGNM